MTVENKLLSALSSIGIPVSVLRYDGEGKEYIVFNYDEIQNYAESTSFATRVLLQVHYFLPYKVNPTVKKRTIANAIYSAGFTFPSITNASDGESQHYVFECEAVMNINGNV